MLTLDRRSWAIDPAKTFLGAVVSDRGLSWFLAVRGLKSADAHQPYSLEIDGMRFPINSWRNLVGQTLTAEQLDATEGQATIYLPENEEHELITHLNLRVGEKKEGIFSVTLQGLAGEEVDSPPLSFEGLVSFRHCIIHCDSRDELEMAKQRFSKYLDMSDFVANRTSKGCVASFPSEVPQFRRSGYAERDCPA